MPNSTKDKEKKTLIARTAATNLVALISIYKYQFQARGIKKCHIPKPIEALMPTITNILTGRFIVLYLGGNVHLLFYYEINLYVPMTNKSHTVLTVKI